MNENSHRPRGHYGVGIYEPQSTINVGTIVRAAGCFGADYVVSIGKEYDGSQADVGHYRHIPVFNFPNWENFENSIPKNSEIVLVDYDPSAYDIDEFQNPERAAYMIGSEGSGFPQEILEKGYRSVYINSEFCLNAAMAASVVLRERYNNDRE